MIPTFTNVPPLDAIKNTNVIQNLRNTNGNVSRLLQNPEKSPLTKKKEFVDQKKESDFDLVYQCNLGARTRSPGFGQTCNRKYKTFKKYEEHLLRVHGEKADPNTSRQFAQRTPKEHYPQGYLGSGYNHFH